MLELLCNSLSSASSHHEKIALLNTHFRLESFLERFPFFRTFLAGLAPECETAFKQLIAAGQAEHLFENIDPVTLSMEKLRDLLEKLVAIDDFYREIGGIAGYQLKILQLLKEKESNQFSGASFHSPSFVEIADETEEVKEAISWGIEGLPEMAEIYALGGAADRLHLIDGKTGCELPAAKLNFAGKTLLEHLVRDLAAREYLYYQTYGKQITTPIAIMTSPEKNNHKHVSEIFESFDWFGRPKDLIRFFTQPLVPAVNESGQWCLQGPLKPLMKPGGHGAIWKLARDKGIFSWLEGLGRKKALIRQINNPIAGLDYGLLAFTGFGWKKGMIFGFASCPRLLGAAEGVNVLVEREKEIVLTNIEYCDFTKFGIEDLPLKEGEPNSRFSSNTNILFADLKAIEKAVDQSPFPGLLINLKKSTFTTESGEKKEEMVARLESTMQNIADVFVEEKIVGAPLKTKRTFVTYNRRHKTISTAKKAYLPRMPLKETPENCFYDLLLANRELLENYCGFSLPPQKTVEEYLRKGPDSIFLYHPALGPLYSLIREKIQGGSLGSGSELILEVSKFKATHLNIRGSLHVIAEQVMGHFDAQKILCYSDQVGECILENVTVETKKIDWENSQPFWKMELQRPELVKIILKGKSRFIAKDVLLQGNHIFTVEDGTEMRVSENGRVEITSLK